jgi:hypothetical protein
MQVGDKDEIPADSMRCRNTVRKVSSLSAVPSTVVLGQGKIREPQAD